MGAPTYIIQYIYTEGQEKRVSSNCLLFGYQGGGAQIGVVEKSNLHFTSLAMPIIYNIVVLINPSPKANEV